MLKFLVTFILAISISSLHAQDSTLKEYAGKYTYASGSIIPSSELLVDGNVLKAISEQGNATLEKVSKDTFAVVEHNGMAYFSRNAEGKVARIKVVIGDLVLEGTKDGVTALLLNNKYFYTRKEAVSRK